MPRKEKKKYQVAEEEPKVEVITKVEVIFADTKATTGVEPKYKWGEVYRMISSQIVPDSSFEDMHIYTNITISLTCMPETYVNTTILLNEIF